MDYDKDIIEVLVEAGEAGLSVQKIARHVYNASNTFFNTVRYEDIHRYVLLYVKKHSKCPNSMIEKTETRGIYRINGKSEESQQLLFQFQEDVPDKIEPVQYEDQSLSLFD
ncbi:MAG: hypothetical protein PUH24_02985 [Prevotellaceae bacterium]|nr:hypothetical protein [Prevotella sp.]MDD7257233.1 hypothetical protein [Prevotellaceae bacterium]MDY6130693.1 hypothetical protein [Prevotella sp.]